MATCPICGKEFKPCATKLRTAFNWKAVACSWDCASQYIERIQASRMKAQTEQNTKQQ